MEAFSDGVLAIVLTTMVLEMKVPHGTEWSALMPLLPVFGSYVMSFIYVGLAFVMTWASIATYILVAAIWFIPDRRFETALRANG